MFKKITKKALRWFAVTTITMLFDLSSCSHKFPVIDYSKKETITTKDYMKETETSFGVHWQKD